MALIPRWSLLLFFCRPTALKANAKYQVVIRETHSLKTLEYSILDVMRVTLVLQLLLYGWYQIL